MTSRISIDGSSFAEWECVTTASQYKKEYVAERNKLADAAKNYEWEEMLHILEENPAWVNCTRLSGSTGRTPLHQAAYGGAPAYVVEKLIELGAWRTLPEDHGKKAIDLAQERGNTHLVSLLEPKFSRFVPPQELEAIQIYFHEVILSRAEFLLKGKQYRLPVLSVLLEKSNLKLWCPIPGMYGGFTFWLSRVGENAVLTTESHSRVVGGSGQRHKITSSGSSLVAAGFD